MKENALNPNPLVRFLDKPANQFTREDIIKFIEVHEIEMLNFRYVAEDGKLKTLNFNINSRAHLETVLSTGERVDGSSLFSYIDAGSSDLYVVPRYKTAFVNPFEEIPTLDILCSYYNSEGKPLESAPEYLIRKAHNEFQKATGMNFLALGELEYYVMTERDEYEMYPTPDQKGYHASDPFAKFEDFRREAMHLIAQAGGQIKYGHSEVGNFHTDDMYYEQQEIEFSPCMAEDAADQMVIAKWMLRKLSYEYGFTVSLAPKITVGKAGSGLHIHMMLEKDGKNMMVKDGALSNEAKRMIAGILESAGALTAFGNTIPTSYLRLVPHQEAPTNICWGDRNRSVLVRVPLGWLADVNMVDDANPQQKEKPKKQMGKQTVEIRSGDGSADIYAYIAGLIVAARYGLEKEDALDVAEKLYVDVNIFEDEHKDKLEQLKGLPDSCYKSAEELEKMRDIFQANHVFPDGMIDAVIKKLKSFDDKNLSEELYGKHDKIAKLVDSYLHCM
ncbi:MAG: glutamine synthetase family protein [Bacteroidota bacterium]|nr:glutamine synthetase family protein [Bacteroidota bacterium]